MVINSVMDTAASQARHVTFGFGGPFPSRFDVVRLLGKISRVNTKRWFFSHPLVPKKHNTMNILYTHCFLNIALVKLY